MDLRMALVAHDARKVALLGLANDYLDVLRACRICATYTTGTLLRDRFGLAVECFRSGPRGGDAQIAARIAEGGVDLLIFLRDPLTAHPHDADIVTLLRISDLANLACATNEATARIVLGHARQALGGGPAA